MTTESDAAVRWQRVPRWVHRVVEGETMLAAAGDEHRTLGGLATAVWVALEEPAETRELLDRITEWWPGSELDPSALDDALTQLADHGVIERAHIEPDVIADGLDA